MSEFDADVIIVGAGILGALAAYRLAAKGKSVMILEAGPRVSRWRVLEAFRNAPVKGFSNFYPEIPGVPKSSGGRYSDQYLENVGPMKWDPGYLRLVGGTTWHWSSAFWRLLPNDFKLKTLYGVGRDWPISYDELEPWYTLAEQITGCSGNAADDQSGHAGQSFPPRSAPYPLPPEQWSRYTKAVATGFDGLGYHFIDEPHLRATQTYGGRPACAGNNNCSPLCPIGAMFSGDMAVALAEEVGARVLPQTVAWKLELGPGRRIAGVHTMAHDGTKARRTARAYILAAHAIETPKLLLMSGVANSSDMVGRNLMTHPSLIYEALARDEMWPGRGPVQQGSVNDLRDGQHRRFHSAIRYSSNNRVPNPMIAERLIRQGIIGSELDKRIRHDSARYINFIAGTESLPDPTRRITLSNRRDGLGLPTPRIHMDMDDYARASGNRIASDFSRIDRAFAISEALGDRTAWRLPAHPMGSTIMGEDPAVSVVDRDCRTHDHSNLFITSTSVFPSAAVVNPTLTGAALALRTAELVSRET